MAKKPTKDILNKKVINYYASFFEVSKQLDQKQFYKFNTAIFSVMFYEDHIDNISFDDKLLSIAWLSIKHSLRASIDGFCSKNQIDYEDTLSKGVTKGLDKGLTNNVNEKEKGKDKEKEKEKGNNNIDAFAPNNASLHCVNSVYPNCDVNSLVDNFKDQARNRAKPFKDLQSGFRNYVNKGWVKPVSKTNTELSYSEITQRLKQERENINSGNVPLDGLVNKMRIM
jgi:hypothetical protein